MTDNCRSAGLRLARLLPRRVSGDASNLRLLVGLVAALLLVWHVGMGPPSLEVGAGLEPTLSIETADEDADRPMGKAAACSIDAVACSSLAVFTAGTVAARTAVAPDDPTHGGFPAGWERPPERQGSARQA
ncbi:hypothetical protein AB4144_04310 [Rhizobiaceae sp. 2RAB30]